VPTHACLRSPFPPPCDFERAIAPPCRLAFVLVSPFFSSYLFGLVPSPSPAPIVLASSARLTTRVSHQDIKIVKIGAIPFLSISSNRTTTQPSSHSRRLVPSCYQIGCPSEAELIKSISRCSVLFLVAPGSPAHEQTSLEHTASRPFWQIHWCSCTPSVHHRPINRFAGRPRRSAQDRQHHS
jgi:hypothetical protein